MNRFQSYSVLMVDDDMESLECMGEYLDLEFSTVYRAVSVKDAFTLIMQKKPDIIFTDIYMPENDGFSLVEQLYARRIKIPVIIISAYDDKEKLLKAIKLGIVDYLIKPLDSKKLKDAMRLCYEKLKLAEKEILLDENLLWNQEKSLLMKNSRPIKLTESETKLLQILIKNINVPMKNIDIFYYLWNYEQKEYNSKNIRNIIYKLRKKLDCDSLIKNIYGGKYMISTI
ncbi:MAG: response regulator [Sulfurospirillum sp.]